MIQWRGGKNTQKNYTKNDLHDPDNRDGVITHLEPDILECEVKWALGSITAKQASRFPAELFQVLKDAAAKGLHSICQQIWKMQQWPHDWKMLFIAISKKGNAKECSNYHPIALIFSSVQLLSHVQLFVIPWIATCQASLSITNSRTLLKLTFIRSVMPANYLILCRPILLLPSISDHENPLMTMSILK